MLSRFTLVAAVVATASTAFAKVSFCSLLLADVRTELAALLATPSLSPAVSAADEDVLMLALALRQSMPRERRGRRLRGAFWRDAEEQLAAYGGRLESGSPSRFSVDATGAPVVRLSRPEHFVHEWDHFLLWRDIRAGFVRAGFEDDLAGALANAVLLTPKGVLYAEARAALAELEAIDLRTPLSEEEVTRVLHRRSHPFVMGLCVTRQLRNVARQTEVFHALESLDADWNFLLDGMLAGFDEFHDRARDHFSGLVPSPRANRWDIELGRWVARHGRGPEWRFEQLPQPLRAYVAYRRSLRGHRRDRLVELTESVAPDAVVEVVRAIEARRRRR